MNKKILKKLIPVVILTYTLFFATFAFATSSYVMLEPDAFTGITTGSSANLGSFLGEVFDFGLAAAGALAVIMMIWGGIEYMTTDSWQGKETGKTRVIDALEGLGIALASYLILYTINPCLVQFTKTPGGCQSANIFLNSDPTAGTFNKNTSNQFNQGTLNPNSTLNAHSGPAEPAGPIQPEPRVVDSTGM